MATKESLAFGVRRSQSTCFQGCLEGDMGNRVRWRVGPAELESMFPLPHRGRAQSSQAQDSGVIFHKTGLQERAEEEGSDDKSNDKCSLFSYNPFFSRLDRPALPRE